VALLADESPTVWRAVRVELERAGPAARPALERALRSDDPARRGRARRLLAAIDRRAVVRRLARYVCRPQIDLERALFILGRLHTPRLDPRPYLRALDAMALEVSRRAHQKSGELSRARALVEYLGDELEFGGTLGEFHHPDNIHLHRAIERRAGMPLTLCAIYAFVARRSDLAATVVPLPGHVMLRLRGATDSVIVDPYHGGVERSHKDCLEYLAQHGLAFEPAWFRDADDAALLRRQIQNLARSAEKRGLRREARDLGLVLRAAQAQVRAGGASEARTGRRRR
jgi:regulator of sirC expression with transglutaminase-like and TPR domain